MTFYRVGQSDTRNEYIKQDDYLSVHRGEYAEPYGALSPWRGKWGMKIIQEYKITDNNKLQFSIDILTYW